MNDVDAALRLVRELVRDGTRHRRPRRQRRRSRLRARRDGDRRRSRPRGRPRCAGRAARRLGRDQPVRRGPRRDRAGGARRAGGCAARAGRRGPAWRPSSWARSEAIASRSPQRSVTSRWLWPTRSAPGAPSPSGFDSRTPRRVGSRRVSGVREMRRTHIDRHRGVARSLRSLCSRRSPCWSCPPLAERELRLLGEPDARTHDRPREDQRHRGQQRLHHRHSTSRRGVAVDSQVHLLDRRGAPAPARSAGPTWTASGVNHQLHPHAAWTQSAVRHRGDLHRASTGRTRLGMAGHRSATPTSMAATRPPTSSPGSDPYLRPRRGLELRLLAGQRQPAASAERRSTAPDVEPNFIPIPETFCGLAVDSSFLYWGSDSGNTVGRVPVGGGTPNGSLRPERGTTQRRTRRGVAVNSQYVFWGNSGCAATSSAGRTSTADSPEPDPDPGPTDPVPARRGALEQDHGQLDREKEEEGHGLDQREGAGSRTGDAEPDQHAARRQRDGGRRQAAGADPHCRRRPSSWR